MTASTARIDSSLRPSGHRGGRVRADLVRELELGPAPRAQGVVEHARLTARRTQPARLVDFAPVEHRGEQPDERHTRRDQEPEEERRPLDPADDAPGEAEE